MRTLIKLLLKLWICIKTMCEYTDTFLYIYIDSIKYLDEKVYERNRGRLKNIWYDQVNQILCQKRLLNPIMSEGGAVWVSWRII